MNTMPIKNLPIDDDVKYNMTINKVYDSSMSVNIGAKSYYIAIPKNDSWSNISIHNGLKCIVTKTKYYSKEKEFGMLKLIKLDSRNNYYKEKQTNIRYSGNYDYDYNSMAGWIQQANSTRGWD